MLQVFLDSDTGSIPPKRPLITNALTGYSFTEGEQTNVPITVINASAPLSFSLVNASSGIVLNGQTLEITPAAAGTQFFQLQITDARGYSSTKSFSFFADPATPSAQVPGVIQNLALTQPSTTSTQVNASFDLDTYATSYERRFKVGSGTWFDLQDATSNTFAVDSSLFDNAVVVTIGVRGKNALGTSASWTEASITLSLGIPATPNPTVVWNTQQARAEVYWPSVANATGYQVREKIGTGTYSAWENVGTATSYNLAYDGWATNTQITFEVIALNGTLQSVAAGTTSCLVTAPTLPKLSPITITAITYNTTLGRLEVSLSFPASADRMRWDVKVNDAAWLGEQVTTLTSPFYVLNPGNWVNSTKLWFACRAEKADGSYTPSNWSDELSGTIVLSISQTPGNSDIGTFLSADTIQRSDISFAVDRVFTSRADLQSAIDNAAVGAWIGVQAPFPWTGINAKGRFIVGKAGSMIDHSSLITLDDYSQNPLGQYALKNSVSGGGFLYFNVKAPAGDNAYRGLDSASLNDQLYQDLVVQGFGNGGLPVYGSPNRIIFRNLILCRNYNLLDNNEPDGSKGLRGSGHIWDHIVAYCNGDEGADAFSALNTIMKYIITFFQGKKTNGQVVPQVDPFGWGNGVKTFDTIIDNFLAFRNHGFAFDSDGTSSGDTRNLPQSQELFTVTHLTAFLNEQGLTWVPTAAAARPHQLTESLADQSPSAQTTHSIVTTDSVFNTPSSVYQDLGASLNLATGIYSAKDLYTLGVGKNISTNPAYQGKGFDYLRVVSTGGGFTPPPSGDYFDVDYTPVTNYALWQTYINPERGWYESIRDETNVALSQGSLSVRGAGKTLVHWYIPLVNYKQTDTLPSTFLNNVKTTLTRARAAGVKLIPRPYYIWDYVSAAELGNMPTKTRIKGHATQINAVLNEDTDVISHLYAGYYDAYGEWHNWVATSGYGQSDADRAEVAQHLLDTAPSNRQVAFRYPRDIMLWYPTALTQAQAYGGSDQARTAHHVDCWNSDASDGGTWSSDGATATAQKAYIQAITNWVFHSGETCSPAFWTSGSQPSAAASRAKLEQFHTEGLNSSTWTNMWAYYDGIGFSNEMKARFGYMYALTNARMHKAFTRNVAGYFSVDIQNTGFGRMHNTRYLQLVLRAVSNGGVFRVTLTPASTMQLLLPGPAETKTLEFSSVLLPASMPTGQFDVFLSFPDLDSRIADRSEYAVKFWNSNWNETLRGHDLAMRITVS